LVYLMALKIPRLKEKNLNLECPDVKLYPSIGLEGQRFEPETFSTPRRVLVTQLRSSTKKKLSG